jgi:ferredoxin-NADP reductase/Na+-transporting NADH:ubiquinone oxidoreductase subunit NqrB
MMQLIDKVLNRFTMYRLTLYYLAALVGLGVILAAFGVVAARPLDILATTALLLAVCLVMNVVISRIMRIHSNPESSLITALIMALIMGPVSVFADPKHALIIVLSGAVAVATKYLLAIRRQHLFNPAAAGALFSGLVFGSYASWWVGSIAILPLVVAGGLLLIRKISRLRLAGIFIAAFIVFNVGLALIQGLGLDMVLQSLLFVFSQTSLIFFLVVMFTEPMTSPKRFSHQIIYAAIVAFLYQPQLAIAGQNLTPEEALLIGNLFSFIVSPSFKVRLTLKESARIGEGMMSFTFKKPKGFTHRLGQYMEWSLPLSKGDSRGNRRHFSIASSPTEPDIMIAARFYPVSSAYKRELQAMESGQPIVAGELGGDFVLPRDPTIPLAFVAGGIGITPFRSMIKYLTDRNEHRDIVLLYSNYSENEIVFRDVFEEAKKLIGLKVVYTLTDASRIRPDWCGARGFIGKEMITREVPDFASRSFYVSGSPGMVNTMKSTLRTMGVSRRNVHSDYFPGYSS